MAVVGRDHGREKVPEEVELRVEVCVQRERHVGRRGFGDEAATREAGVVDEDGGVSVLVADFGGEGGDGGGGGEVAGVVGYIWSCPTARELENREEGGVEGLDTGLIFRWLDIDHDDTNPALFKILRDECADPAAAAGEEY